MPDNIYGINVGQVETPASGGLGGRGGGIGAGNNALNTLMRAQMKMADIEADKQKQATQNANTLFQVLVKGKGAGMKDEGDYLGFTPQNEYESKLAQSALSAINDNINKFAADGTNIGYANMQKNIDEILNNKEIIYAGAANKRIGGALKTIQEKGLNVHPYYWDQYQRYQNSGDPSSYDLRTLVNPQEYVQTPVDVDKDFAEMKDKGLSFEIRTDPDTKKNFIVTTQDNKEQMTGFLKNKYRHNFEMDFEKHKADRENDPVYGQFMAAGGNEEDAKKRYVDERARMAADELAVTKNEKPGSILGRTMEGEQDIRNMDIAKAKKIGEDRTEEWKKREEISNANKIARMKQQGESWIKAAEARGVNVKNMTAGQLAVVNAAHKKAEEKGIKLDAVKVADAARRIKEDKYKSEEEYQQAVYDEATSYNLNSTKADHENIYKTIQKNVNEGNKQYTDFNIIGDPTQHSLIEEKNSPAHGIFDYPTQGKDAVEQTFVDEITGTKIKGGNQIATGFIITKNSDYFDGMTSAAQKLGKPLDEKDIESYNKRGYKLDPDEKYYRVPVEFKLNSLASTGMADRIKYMESEGTGGYNAYNPKSGASGAYQFLKSTGKNLAIAHGLAKDENDYLEKMKDPAFQDKLYSVWDQTYLKPAAALLQKRVSQDPTLESDLLKTLNEIGSTLKDPITMTAVPNWVWTYLLHHDGSVDTVVNSIKNKNTADYDNAMAVIKKALKAYGGGDVDDSFDTNNDYNNVAKESESTSNPTSTEAVKQPEQKSTKGLKLSQVADSLSNRK